MAADETLEITQPSELEFEVVRAFAAPRELVFQAFTDPQLLQQWMLGPGDWSMPVCQVDLRVGGGYRQVWRKPGAPDMGLTGTYLEVTPPERLVATEEFDQDWTGGATTVTTSFDDRAGSTVVTTRIRYSSPEARDEAMRTGMAAGMEAGFQRLEALLSELPR